MVYLLMNMRFGCVNGVLLLVINTGSKHIRSRPLGRGKASRRMDVQTKLMQRQLPTYIDYRVESTHPVDISPTRPYSSPHHLSMVVVMHREAVFTFQAFQAQRMMGSTASGRLWGELHFHSPLRPLVKQFTTSGSKGCLDKLPQKRFRVGYVYVR